MDYHQTIKIMKHKNELSQANAAGKKRQKVPDSDSTSGNGIFKGIHVLVLQAGLGKARTDLFKKQLAAKGAMVQVATNKNTSHVIVDEEMTYPRFCRIMKYKDGHIPANFLIITARWLSQCLSEGSLVDHKEFILQKEVPKLEVRESLMEGNRVHKTLPLGAKNEIVAEACTSHHFSDESSPATSKLALKGAPLPLSSPVKRAAAASYDSDDSNYVLSDGIDEDTNNSGDDDFSTLLTSEGDIPSNNSTPNTSPIELPRGNWVCSRPSTTQNMCHNQHITEKLEVLMKAYENTKDKWRALGYKKAISALKNYGKDITTWDEANAIPGIGTKLADKIWEIIESGHLRKIDYVCKGEEMVAIDLFNNVWGAGPTVSREWVQQGFRTLEDLRVKGKLTKQQQIGLKHYYEFLERMSREEAGDIERTVRETAQSLFPGMLAVVCGSYRRGKQTCGDVDVLITHPDGKSHKGALSSILDALRLVGFITDDLIRVEEKGEQKKYMGVCKLPGVAQKHRRIDIIVAPYDEYPCALVHFTGSGHFNRSMRALAKKKGMSLSEHALRTGVIRRGQEKISEGVSVPVSSEEDIFRLLGLEYREPHERDY